MRKGSGKKTKTVLLDSQQHPAAGIEAFGPDTTGPKQPLESLRESESVLGSFFDSAGVMRGIVEVIAEDDVRHITDNAVTAAFIGMTPEAMKNKSGSELGEPRDVLRMWVSHYTESRKSKKPVTFEYLDKRGELEARLLATVSYLGTLPRGYPRFAYMVIDITERKRAEEAQRESEERFRTLFDTMLEGFCVIEMIFDKEGRPVDYRFLEVNSAFEWQTGLFDAKGKLMRDLAPDHEARWFEIYGKIALTGEPARFENEARALNRWYEVSAFRLGGQESRRVAIFFNDITERKKAEAQVIQNNKTFSELIERAPFGIYVVDSRFRIAQMNTGSQNGAFRNVRPVIGRDFGEAMHILWPKTVAGEIIAAFLHTLKTGEPYHSPRFTNPRFDVKTVESYEWELHRLTLPDGQFGVICYYFDSTKLRNAEQELRLSEERFRTIAETVPVLVCITLLEDSVVLFTNEFCNRAFGQGGGDIIGTRGPDYYCDPADRAKLIDIIRSRGSVDNYQLNVKRSDGTPFWIMTSVRPIIYQGQPAIIGASIDITEQKRIEGALHEANSRTAAILEGIADTYYSLDTEWRFTTVNPAAERAPFGRPAAELLGKVIWDLYPNLVGTRIQRHYLDAAEKFTHEHYEAQSPLNNQWYEVFMQGQKGGVDVYMRDITERKQAEERIERLFSEVTKEKDRLSALINSISDEIWFADTSKSFVLANPSALWEFGLKSEHLDVEKFALALEVFRPDGSPRPVEEAPSLRALSGEIIKNQEEIVRTPGSGELKYRQVSASPVRDEKGDIIGSVSVVHDITEQKQAEEALLKARDELELRVEERTTELKETAKALDAERHRLYDVLEALPVYVCLLDKDYRMPFANRYFRETFMEPAGRRCYDFLFNRSKPCEICETYKVLKTGAPHHWFWTGPNRRDYDIYDFPFTDTDGSSMILEMGIDITERKKAEAAFQKASAYNRSLIEASLDPLVTINPDGTISDVNEATIRVTGFSRGELIGTDFSDYFTEPNEAKTGYERVFRDGSVTDYALEIRHRNGQVTPVLYNATVYRDEAGNAIGVFAAARDITERRKAEEEIKKAYIYNRSLIEASLDPLVTINPDGTITDVNEATVRVTGFSRKELIGTDFSNYFTEPEKAKAGYEKVFRDGSVTDYALEIWHRNGQVTPVLYNVTVYQDEAGNVIGAFAGARDITERKKAEEALRKEHDLLEKRVKDRTSELVQANVKLREEISQRRLAESLVKKTVSELYAAIESTADGIYVVDRAGRIIRYNQNFASMWKIPDDLLQSGEDGKVSEYLKTLIKNPGLFSESNDENNCLKDRETYDMLELLDGRIFERYAKPQKMDALIIGRVMSYRDVTDRRHAEEKLIASLQEKETLIREIHHRVKNNLQIISGLLDMTRMRTPDSTTHSILTDMMMKIKTMAQIHTRLYESKQFDKINMGSQIRDQVADLSSIYGRSGAEIQSEIEAQDIYLPVDQAIPCALVVNEILSNAFKHAFKGKKHGNLMVSATQVDDHIRIIVRDNGVGIPNDMDVERTASLGLKLIRNLVLQLSGSVTITSDHGTEVIVEFPLHAGGK
jgi:PAS domain S-box-containing protein